MTSSRSSAAFVCVLLTVGVRTALAYTPTAATQAFLDQHPGVYTLIQDGRLVGLFGVPFTSDDDPETTTDDFVAGFLAEHGDAFGVDDVALVPEGHVTVRNRAIYTYTQELQGLPVHATGVNIPVFLGDAETIDYVGFRLVQTPDPPLPDGSVASEEGVGAVAASPLYGHLVAFTAPEEVVYETERGTVHRAWRFYGYDADEAYLFLVDTSTAEILGALNQVYDSGFDGRISGRVVGHRTPCCNADNPDIPETCPVDADMRGVRLELEGGSPAVYADTNGFYEFTGLEEGVPVTVTSRLVGQCGATPVSVDCVTVENYGGDGNGINLVPNPSLQTVTPTAAGVTNVDFVFNTADPDCAPTWPPEFDTAQVNAFLAVQETHDWFRNILPPDFGNPIDKPVTCSVNTLPRVPKDRLGDGHGQGVSKAGAQVPPATSWWPQQG